MNQISLLLFFMIIPVFLILLYIYQKDKNKEPILLLLQLFFLGIIAGFITIHFSNLLTQFISFMNYENRNNFLDIFLYTFITIALVEESFKWLMVYMRGYYTKEFDELYDIIIYSVFVSLGFAFLENAYYIIQAGQVKIALIRAIFAIPGHTCDAIFMGYYLSLAKQFHYQNQKKIEIKYILLSILIPTILHGIYDFCILSKINILIYVFIIFIIALYIISLKKLKEVANNNKTIKYSNPFCKTCGAKLDNEICPNCNKKQE